MKWFNLHKLFPTKDDAMTFITSKFPDPNAVAYYLCTIQGEELKKTDIVMREKLLVKDRYLSSLHYENLSIVEAQRLYLPRTKLTNAQLLVSYIKKLAHCWALSQAPDFIYPAPLQYEMSLVRQKTAFMNGDFIKDLTTIEVSVILRTSPIITRELVGEILSDKNYGALLKDYMKTFSFGEAPLYTVLQHLLCTFKVPNEAMKIDKIMEAFANAAYDAGCWKEYKFTEDSLYMLCYSMMMLNTELHNAVVKHPMTKSQYLANSPSAHIPKELVGEIYDAVKECALFDSS